MKQVLNFFGCGVANRIGNIDGCCTRFNRGFDHAFKIITFRADGVFCGKLHIICVVPRQLNHADGTTDDFILFHFQFKFAVKRRRCDESMDAARFGRFDRVSAGANIALNAARERADCAVLHCLSNGFDGFEIAG